MVATPYTEGMEMLAVLGVLAALGVAAASFGYDSRDGRPNRYV